MEAWVATGTPGTTGAGGGLQRHAHWFGVLPLAGLGRVNRYHAWKGEEANEPTPLYALMGVPSLVLIVVTLGSVRLRADEIINPCTLPDIPYWLWLLAGCAWPWPF